MLFAALFLIAQQTPADGARMAAEQTTPSTVAARERVVIVSGNVPAGWVDRLYGGLLASGLATADGRDRIGVDKPDNGQLNLVRIDAARDLLLTAQAAMRTFEYPKVRVALDEAEALLLRTAAPLSHVGTYRELLLMRAGLDISEGSGDAARKELALLARLDPQLETLHPGLYPPPLVEAYAQVRAAQAASNAAAVLAITPRNARQTVSVRVDASPPQNGALTLRLQPGPHIVTLSAPDTVTFARRLDLVTGRTAVLSPHLPAPGASAQRREGVRNIVATKKNDLKRMKAAEGLATHTGCTAVVHLEQTGMTLYRRGRAPVRLPLSGDALVDANAVRVALTAVPRPATTDETETAFEAETPFGLYAVLGVAGVAATGFVVGLVVAGSFIGFQIVNPPEDPPPLARGTVVFCCGPPPSQGGN